MLKTVDHKMFESLVVFTVIFSESYITTDVDKLLFGVVSPGFKIKYKDSL